MPALDSKGELGVNLLFRLVDLFWIWHLGRRVLTFMIDLEYGCLPICMVVFVVEIERFSLGAEILTWSCSAWVQPLFLDLSRLGFHL